MNNLGGLAAGLTIGALWPFVLQPMLDVVDTRLVPLSAGTRSLVILGIVCLATAVSVAVLLARGPSDERFGRTALIGFAIGVGGWAAVALAVEFALGGLASPA